jgi:2-iminobutanoate/2-iminopropanoate deaminase
MNAREGDRGGFRSISSADAPRAIGPYSHAIAYGDLIFCSGHIGLDPKSGELVAGGIREQTRRTLENIAAVLKSSESDLGHVLKTTVFLIDLADFADMNEVYGEIFAGHAPARATVQVAGLPRGAKVEIECVAIRVR